MNDDKYKLYITLLVLALTGTLNTLIVILRTSRNHQISWIKFATDKRRGVALKIRKIRN